MFESFVEKFQYVQDGISSSFRGLSLGEPLNAQEPLNFEVGCATLSKYHSAWEEIHRYGEVNARLARHIDSDIGRISCSILREKRNWENFQKECSNLAKMKTEAETVVNTIGYLRNMCTDIEEELVKLENLIEIQEYYRKEAQEKIKLSNYRVEKLQNLDAYRELLAEEYDAKVHELEDAESTMRQTKKDLFQAKFREDLEVYKRTGVVHRTESPRPSDPEKLEEVTLDTVKDREYLEEYLNS